MRREITAPEALTLYRCERNNRKAEYLSEFKKIMGRLHIFRWPLAQNLLTAVNEWQRLVSFLLLHADDAGAEPQDIANLQEDTHDLLYLKALMEDILR